MVWIVGHDKTTGAPKTRWSTGINSGAQLEETVRVFVQCISDISDIYLHDSAGHYIALSEYCDSLKIPYKKGGASND